MLPWDQPLGFPIRDFWDLGRLARRGGLVGFCFLGLEVRVSSKVTSCRLDALSGKCRVNSASKMTTRGNSGFEMIWKALSEFCFYNDDSWKF